MTANTEETALLQIIVDHANGHHTKTDADLGEYKVIVDLHERGYIVSNPLTEHAPFDLIIWKNGDASTVQVEFRSKDNGKVNIRFRATQWDTDGSYDREIDKGPIDICCIYCPEPDECYYFDPEEFGRSATFRIDPPKNEQSEGVHFAENYKRVP